MNKIALAPVTAAGPGEAGQSVCLNWKLLETLITCFGQISVIFMPLI